MSKNIIKFPVIKTAAPSINPKVPAILSKLAYCLMFKLHIKPDMSLVTSLGKGTEHSNHEALITWLMSNYDTDEINELREPLDKISKDLYNYLNDQLSNMEDV